MCISIAQKNRILTTFLPNEAPKTRYLVYPDKITIFFDLASRDNSTSTTKSAGRKYAVITQNCTVLVNRKKRKRGKES